HPWKAWKLSTVPKKLWDDEITVKEYLDWLCQRLSIHKHEDWYSVRWEQIARLGGSRLLQKSGGIMALLTKYYPHHPWDATNLGRLSKGQSFLYNIVRGLFPTEKAEMDYKHP